VNKKSKTILKATLVVLAVFAVSAIAFRLYQIQKEKNDFAQAEKYITSIAQRIEQIVGTADNETEEKSCGRANQKFAEGPLSCAVSVTLEYSNKDYVESNVLLEKIKSNFSGKLRIGSVDARDAAFNQPRQENDSQVFYQDSSSIGSIQCILGYRYRIDDFTVSVTCVDAAIKQIYPLRD
jgi:Tfp pilus assembly major pilin PilA